MYVNVYVYAYIYIYVARTLPEEEDDDGGDEEEHREVEPAQAGTQPGREPEPRYMKTHCVVWVCWCQDMYVCVYTHTYVCGTYGRAGARA
jgi:hypothetical protein